MFEFALRAGLVSLFIAAGAMDAAQAGNLVPIHTFNGTDGQTPTGLAFGTADHSLYGVVQNGGAHSLGGVFKLTPPTKGAVWSYALIYSFAGGNDGANPQGIVFDEDGNIYGTTLNGGGSAVCGQGCGTVFELTPPAHPSGTWTETVLHRFQGGDDGKWAQPGLILHKHDLYGTTQYGGGTKTNSLGTVFRLKRPKSGKNWTETILHSFVDTTKGWELQAGVVFGGKNIFGTTFEGGTSGWGVVYELVASNGGTKWTQTIAEDFDNFHDASNPIAPLIFRDGVVYGTAESGGNVIAYGSVFSLTPAGNTWKFDILHAFTGGADGGLPGQFVFAPKDGSLVGTTRQGGGVQGVGTIYQLTPPPKNSTTWGKNTLWNFTGGTDGGVPVFVVFGSDGAVYGVTIVGGTGQGVVFKLTF